MTDADPSTDALLRQAGERAGEAPGDHLDDAQLLAWRAESLDDTVAAAHLGECATCRDRLSELATPESLLEWAESRLLEPPAPARRRWWPVAAGLAAAAALLLFALGRGGPHIPPFTLEGPSGGVEAVRGDGPASAVFLPTSTFKMVLRLEGAPTEPLSLRVFVAREGEAPRAAPASAVTPGAEGVWRIKAPAAELFGAPGRWAVYLVLGEPDSLAELAPADAPEQAARTARIEYREGE